MPIHGLRGRRPLNGRPGLRMAVWSQVKVCGRRRSLPPIGCTPAVLHVFAFNGRLTDDDDCNFLDVDCLKPFYLPSPSYPRLREAS